MELKSFVEVGLRRWPVVLLAFVFTIGLTFELAVSQESTYKSCGTFVVRPSGEAGAGALDALVRGPEINATFASIARSGAVRSNAEQRLPAGTDADGVRVSAEVATGTNTLLICARGNDPESAYAVAAAVGDATVEYIRGLDETYDLVSLDRATVPDSAEPQRTSLTLAIGAFCGLLFGFVLASVLEFLVSAWRAARTRRAADPVDVVTVDPAGDPVDEDDAGDAVDEDSAGEEPVETVDDAPHEAPAPAAESPEHDGHDGPDGRDGHDGRDGVAATRAAGDRRAVEELLQRRGSGDGPVGYAIVHVRGLPQLPAPEDDEPSGNGSQPANGSHPGDASVLDRCLHEWARSGAGDVLRIDDGSFAIVVRDVTPASASRLLADVAASISAADVNAEAGEWTLELTVGTYRSDTTAGEAGPETGANGRRLGRKNGRPRASEKAGFPSGPAA
ncbi:MAG: hypothetical protein KatS3mg010_1117 [Acidimicrobiia bacterium]|nr:MAG: hypothetical protein KatS3mg010_1117 [Acidimicrobiia bacterium]